jgi:hypothetical protein
MDVRKFVILAALSIGITTSHADNVFHRSMMESTCKLVGNTHTQGMFSIGSGVIIGKATTNQANFLRYTLVTANHVLSDMAGESATMIMRRLKNADHYERVEIPLKIRSGTNALWKKHPDVDLAAMFVNIPSSCSISSNLLNQGFLFTDEQLRKYEIYPGCELLCLGYPLGGESNTEGCFPILRGGKISSHPLLPTKETKTFQFDFTVFGGNSGGPVYLYQQSPVYGGTVHLASEIFGIMGIVTQSYYSNQRVPLALGAVIHASFIRELIDSLP